MIYQLDFEVLWLIMLHTVKDSSTRVIAQFSFHGMIAIIFYSLLSMLYSSVTAGKADDMTGSQNLLL